MRTLIALVLSAALVANAFAQKTTVPPPPGVPATHPLPNGTSPNQVAQGIALLIVAGVGASCAIYAFWKPGPRWRTLVLWEKSRLTGTANPILTNTVWQSGKQMPYAFTVYCTNEFSCYYTTTLNSGN